MKDLYDTLIKFFFEEFTWKKLRFLLGVVAVAIAALFVYEHYTSSFQFSRLQKATDLLAKLQDIQTRAAATNSAPDIEYARKELVAQVVQAINQKPISLDFIPSKLSIQMDALLKFVAGAALWCLCALFYIPKLRTNEGKKSFIGFIGLAGIAGAAAMFVPSIWWPWFHLLILPWLASFAMLVSLVPFALIAARKVAQRNHCINNLRQIHIAKHQWALDNDKPVESVPTFEDIAKYLGGNQRVTLCPCGGIYTLGIIGANPTCSFRGHAVTPH